MSTRKPQSRRDSPETLEIRVFESVFVGYAPFPGVGELPEFKLPNFEPGFARVLEPIKALMYAPQPPPKMGMFLVNPRPAFL